MEEVRIVADVDEERGVGTGASGWTVSCLVPVFNGERFLAETLQSVLAQSRPPFEVLVVDDASTDGSAAIADGFGAPVSVIRRPHRGSAAAREAGLAAARGDFIAMVDADDIWHPEKLGRQLERFECSPELDVSLVMAENFWQPELAGEEALYRTHNRVRLSHSFITMLARRSAFVSVPIDVTIPRLESMDWFMRAAEAGLRIDVIPEILVQRRMHATSMSHAHPTDGHLHLIKSMLDRRRASAQTET